jgi:hypothetical protein
MSLPTGGQAFKPQGLASGLQAPTQAPLFPQEWALMNPPDGLDVVNAWNALSGGLGAGSYTQGGQSKPIVVAYFAEPLPPLPDFQGQLVPGFDFTAWLCGTYPNSYISTTSGQTVSQSCNSEGFVGQGTQVFDGAQVAPNVQPGVNYNTPDNPGGEAGLDASNMVANGYGVIGVAYDAKLMPLVVFSDNNPFGVPGGYEGDFAYAAEIVWAVDHGAQILNNSLGGAYNSPLEQQAVDYALNHGVTFVAAAGDNGDSLVSSPADLPGVLAATATTQDGNLAFLSQIAPYVQFAAPGNNIVTAEALGFQSVTPSSADPLGYAPEPGYYFVAGTSSSSPYVVGIAALIDAAYEQKFGQPMTPGEIEQVLYQTGHPLPSGTQNYIAQLRIPDAAQALAYVEGLTHPLSDPNGYAFVAVLDSQGYPVPDANVILTNAEHTYYANTATPGFFVNSPEIGQNGGVAEFPNIAPGTYTVEVGASETLYDGDFPGTGNPADRLTAVGSITVRPGGLSNLSITTVSLPPTTLTLELSTNNPNLQLAVAEPGNTSSGSVGGFVTDGPNGSNGAPQDGTFQVSHTAVTYTTTYTLNAGSASSPYTPGLYLFGVYTGALKGPANGVLTIVENGQSFDVPLSVTPNQSTQGAPQGIVEIGKKK